MSDPRADWLEERRQLVTASDAAAILGFHPTRSAIHVWAEKRGLVEVEDVFVMRWGRLVESAIAQGYAEETGREVFDLGATVIRRHPDIPWLGATLDREQLASVTTPAPAGAGPGRTPAEIKAQTWFKLAQWVEDGPPLPFRIQLQIQLACTAATWGSLVGLFGGMKLQHWDLLRNDRFIAAALPKLEEFWSYVKSGDQPPAPDEKESSSLALAKIYPEENGLTVVLPGDTLSLVQSWEQAEEDVKVAQVKARRLENELRFRMKDASVGLLSDSTSLYLPKRKRKAYTTHHEATEYRSLRRFIPKGARIR